jgi:hypothetical protein
MPYGTVETRRDGNRLHIVITLPETGEPSGSGLADNLVDPRTWIDVDDTADHLGIRITVCRPYRRSPRRSGARRQR